MSIVTAATVPLHPFPNKDEEDDNNVGMSLSPAPSPHTTLTPIEAARLSSQTKEVVNNNENSDQSMPVAEDGAIAALLPRSEDDKLDKILTPTGTLNMSGLVSLNSNASDDGNANDGHSAATCNKEQTKEQMLEDRVADLEQRLASLAEICDSLMKQQQVRKQCYDEQERIWGCSKWFVWPRIDYSSNFLICHKKTSFDVFLSCTMRSSLAAFI